MTGAEEAAKRKVAAVEEGGSDDIDKGESGEQSTSAAKLQSLQRCRILWEMLFLSDIVDASGRQLLPHLVVAPSPLA